jgi:putative N6-adenine-specific DNA methylase
VKWTELFAVNKTFAVKGAVNSTLFKHSQFPFLLIKDAIVDAFREKTGERPDINVKTPQLVIDLYVNENRGVLSINTSGMPLFQRGYRQQTGEAPLNEVIAAAMLRLSGWDKKTTLVDPFCGSGTILIEAALLACGIPSNVERTHYAFKNLKNFDAELWQSLLDAVPKYPKQLPCKLIGGDISSQMILKTRRNLNGFPFGRDVETQTAAVDELDFPEGPAFLITNPPYGERLEADVEELYGTLGTVMKHKLTGYTCCVISSNVEAFHAIGLRQSRKFRIFNGKLECSYRLYNIYAGSKKQAASEE